MISENGLTESLSDRNYSIPECRDLLPKAAGGGDEPLPEGLFWLLMTGDIPTTDQVRAISKSWAGEKNIMSIAVVSRI